MTNSSTTGPIGTVRLLALGDSYTIGESVEPTERWPVLLGERLELQGVASSIEVQIIARTGWTTDELDAAIDRANPRGPFDLVTLQIGVNNQFRTLALEEYRTGFASLLAGAIGFAGGDEGKVIVVSIPDWGVTPFGQSYEPDRIAVEIDRFNAIAEEETERLGATFVDITSISRSDAPGLVASDGLHPSATQYRLWVEEILPVVRSQGVWGSGGQVDRDRGVRETSRRSGARERREPLDGG